MKKISFIEEDEYMALDVNMKVSNNPAPQKLAMVTETLQSYVSFQEKKTAVKCQVPPLTPLQKELLNFYAQEPSEKQMRELKDFMVHLFNDTRFTTKQTTPTISKQHGYS